MPDTLSGRLASFGIRHEPSATDEQRRDWYDADGVYLGAFDAHEGWAWLKAQERVTCAS